MQKADAKIAVERTLQVESRPAVSKQQSSHRVKLTATMHAFAVTVADDSRPSDSSLPSVQISSSFKLPKIGDLVGNVYRLVRVLGEGMFGKVYVAQREDVPEHQVAMKILPRSLYAGRNVERELVMLATVGHPNVVQLKDHGTTDDYIWLTMPVYEGETLAERLSRGPLGMRDAYDIFVAVAHALEALHAAGLRHQDIKPENIYLAIFGARVHPILLDLGVAAEREATFAAGTMLYASPEQIDMLMGARTPRPLTEKMDTYCLATTLLMSLVGPDRFPGNNATCAVDIVEAHRLRAEQPLIEGALEGLDGRPRELLTEALRRWLAFDPAERPAMNRLAEQLDVLLEPEREASRAEEQRRARQRTSLQRVRIAAGAMLLIGVAGLAVVVAKRESLHLLGQLEEARDQAKKQGAESFHNLDVCNASHQLAKKERDRCEASRATEVREHQQYVQAIERSGTLSEQERAQELATMQTGFNTKLRNCEDEARASEKAANEKAEQLRSAWETEKTALIAARDEQKTLAETQAAEIAHLQEELAKRREEPDPYDPPPAGAPPAGKPGSSPSATAAAPPDSAKPSDSSGSASPPNTAPPSSQSQSANTSPPPEANAPPDYD